MRLLIEALTEAMTLRDVAQKHAPEELRGQERKVPPGYKMVFGRLVKVKQVKQWAKGATAKAAMLKASGKMRDALAANKDKIRARKVGFQEDVTAGSTAPGGRPLSEQLGAYLVEYKTKGWSTTPDKSGKVYKTTPPGKKGVWRTLNGKHVFFPQDGSGPIGGAPGRAGWTKRTGKYHEAGKAPASKSAKKK
jgi:hypothetical protein